MTGGLIRLREERRKRSTLWHSELWQNGKLVLSYSHKDRRAARASAREFMLRTNYVVVIADAPRMEVAR